MIEVEIRARVKDFNYIKEKLKNENARFLKDEIQEDIIFGHDSFLDENKMVVEGGFIARIRTIDENISLEFKEIRRNSGGIEISSKLSNKEQGIILLNKLNFKEAFTVLKTRETYSYDDFIVCLDGVKDLGNFIEIEKNIQEKTEKEKVRKECIALLNKIDKNLIIENKKYGDLIQEKKNAATKPNT